MNAVWTLGAEADVQHIYERMEAWEKAPATASMTRS